MAMLALSTVFARRLLPRLSADTPRTQGLKTWLEAGSFYVSAGSGPGDILFENLVIQEIVPYLAHDFERFALSSMESALQRVPDTMGPKALGWPLIRLYYAAFFGAHAIMRGTGKAVVRIETAQASRLTQIGSLYVPGLRISTGTYQWALRENRDLRLDGHLGRLPDNGGAHEQFWKVFYNFLGSIRDEVTRNREPEATAAIAEISDLRDCLSSNGFQGGTWLSAVRNQITYQHGFGAWFPFHTSDTQTVEYMRRVGLKNSSGIRRDYSPTKQPLLAFAACCQVIASLSHEVAQSLCRNRGNIRFRRLLNSLRASEAA